MKAYVVEASMARVSVRLVDDVFLEQLVALRFAPMEKSPLSTFSVDVSGPELKAKLLANLRDHGVCFSVGPDWSPSEVFEYLRDQGWLKGNYRRVAWSGPGQFTITENC
jgi:hypothetical protein